MERYYIALYLMGIKNDFLRKIITEYSSDSIIRLFEGNLDIFLTDMEWLPYKEIFEDSKKVLSGLERADEIIRMNVQCDIHMALYSAPDYPCNLTRIEILLPLFIIKVQLPMMALPKLLHPLEQEKTS